MIRKQIFGIIIASAVLIASVVLYFAVVAPAVRDASFVEETPDLQEGEEIGASNRFYMYSHLDREDMESIEVCNGYGTYKMVKDENGSFYVDGYDGVALDAEKLSSLVTTCGSTLSKTRVTKAASDEKLEEYGLKDPSAYWIVTDKGGKQYKVYVGRALLTGGGYYCAFAGRASVYVLDTTLADTVLAPVETFVTPYIVFGVSQSDYYTVDNFTVYKGKEKFISIGRVAKEDQTNENALTENVLTYPVPYTPEPENFFAILMGYSAFTGDSTYKLGVTAQTLEECGLDDPTYTVSFEYGDMTYYYFLKDDGEGSYYVYSITYPEIVSKIAKNSIKYMDYDLLRWISPYIFRRDITTISSIKVESADFDDTFYLTHLEAVEKDDPILQVGSESGVQITKERDVKSFREFYGDLLAIDIKDTIPDIASSGEDMDSFVANPENLTLHLEIKTLRGQTLTYDFYRYSTRRCAVAVNGRFDFCVLYEQVKQIETDAGKLLRGEVVGQQ
ncbi:MAG: DUF4340 domain-containing protein [Clostridia bacterium]|nr:DUF4340 domain-containing protein [Clostridia bacterium]